MPLKKFREIHKHLLPSLAEINIGIDNINSMTGTDGENIIQRKQCERSEVVQEGIQFTPTADIWRQKIKYISFSY